MPGHTGAHSGSPTGAGGQSPGPQGQRGQTPDRDRDINNQGNQNNQGFVDTVKKGIESVLAPQNIMPAVINALVPGAGILAMAPNILGAFGFNVNTQPSVAPEDPRGGRADERMLAQIPQQTVPVQLFGGDTVKLQRYEDFMKAGYPPDMAEYLVNQLM